MPEPEVIAQLWVNLTEGAEITGYHREHMIKLARKMWKLPEAEREIRIRKRTNGYDLWLPDLIKYSQKTGRGPRPR